MGILNDAQNQPNTTAEGIADAAEWKKRHPHYFDNRTSLSLPLSACSTVAELLCLRIQPNNTNKFLQVASGVPFPV